MLCNVLPKLPPSPVFLLSYRAGGLWIIHEDIEFKLYKKIILSINGVLLSDDEFILHQYHVIIPNSEPNDYVVLHADE